MRALSQDGEAFIKAKEALRLVPYDDADPNKVLAVGDVCQGTLTVGYGHTGPDVVCGQAITMEKAEADFKADIAPACACVEQAVTVDLNDNQFAALVSFVYNLGCQNLKGSTLLKLLNAGNYTAVPLELNKWVNTRVNGKIVYDPGLAVRRASEGGLWVKGSYARGANVTPEAPPNWYQTAHVRLKAVGTAVTTTGVTGAALNHAADQVNTYATQGWHALAYVGIGIGVVGIIIGIVKGES